MRLTSLTLTNYGPFRAECIAFDPAPGRLNLLIAPNGAGKSVLRGAFCDLLFNIPGQTAMGFRYGYGGMRLAAEAIAPDGTPFAFARRKGQGNTLLDADGAPLDPAALARLLGTADRTLLERLFALDTERLRRGGEALLASDGAVADALLSAAGGLRQARQLRVTLEDARDALAPERKSQTRPFYAALDHFLDAQRRLTASVQRPEWREKQETEFRHLEAALAQARKESHAAAQRLAQLQRVRLVAGTLRQHDDAAAWLAAHPDAPTLPPGTGARLAQAAEALTRAELLLQRERTARDAAAQALAGIARDAAVTDAAKAIDSLLRRASVAAQALRDIPKRAAELAASEDRIAALLRDLGIDLPTARAAEAIPRDALVTEARRLFSAHEKLQAELDRLPDEQAAVTREIERTETELARLPAPADTEAVEREARESRRTGDPAQLAQRAAQLIAETSAALAAAQRRIPVWPEGGVALPVQPQSAYERLDAARADAAARLQAADSELARLRAEDAAEAVRLAKLAEAGPLPNAAAIAAARARRDAGWQLIYRRAFTPSPPPPEAETAWAGETPLPLAFERAVAEADGLADLRNRESARVAQAAELARLRTERQPGFAAAEAARRQADAAHKAARAAWQLALDPLGLAAATTLAELRPLLAGRDKVIDALRERDAAAATRTDLEHRQTEAAQRLARLLGTAAAPAAADLPSLLAASDNLVETARKTEQARTRLRDRLDTQRGTQREKAHALAAAQGRREAWLQDWAAIRAALRRPGTEAPAATVALLDQFAKLETESQKAEALRERLREMREDVAAFGRDAAALAARLAPDLATADGAVIAEEIGRRLAEEQGREKLRKQARATLESAEAAHAKQEQQHATSAIELQTLLAVIGAGSQEAAAPLVALAAERADKARTLQDAAQQLADSGDGRDIAVLRDEVARFATDTIRDDIEAAGNDRTRAEDAAQALAAQIATARDTMAREAEDTASVQAAADQQSSVATLGRVLDEALLMHLAALLLGDALANLDASGSSALLTRIGARFRTLTEGAFERIIAADDGDGTAKLRAVPRDFPGEAKEVAPLSDGTRDQLFLALRLAAIEDHVATAPPLPFIGDDILQTFDDERARAAMQALLDLSAHVQVILLSHHPHLRALAATLGEGRVQVCEIAAG